MCKQMITDKEKMQLKKMQWKIKNILMMTVNNLQMNQISALEGSSAAVFTLKLILLGRVHWWVGFYGILTLVDYFIGIR